MTGRVLPAAALMVLACVQDLPIGAQRGRDGRAQSEAGQRSQDAAPSGNASAADAAGVTADACQPIRCQGRVRACGDCQDNDEDGRVDADDPECWGPCSDDESTLAGGYKNCATGDCFFEPDCGLGNDAQCFSLTPPGCDCHGCCELSEQVAVYLGTVDSEGQFTCNHLQLTTPQACASCETDPECLRPCAAGEECFSMRVAR